MNALTATMVLVSMLAVGALVIEAGGKVRGDKGQGAVNQHMVDCNHDWQP